MPKIDPWPGRPSLALLAGKEEDRFTIFLAELLRYRPFLKRFLSQLLDINSSDANIDAVQISTQFTVENGRPDLCIELPHLLILIEAKVRSFLHENQIVPYARHLCQMSSEGGQTDCRLVLLAPQSALDDTLQTAIAQLATVKISSVKPLAISWESVASVTQEAAKVFGERQTEFRVHAESFADLIHVTFGEAVRPLSSEEVAAIRDAGIGRPMLFVWRLVEGVINEFKSRDELIPRIRAKDDYYGINLLENAFWFGAWFGPWSVFGLSPLWISVEEAAPSTRLKLAPRRLPYRHAGDPKTYELVPIPLICGEELAHAVKRVTAIVQVWIDAMQFSQ